MMFLKREDKEVEEAMVKERTRPVLGPAFENSFKKLNVNIILR